MSEKKEDTDITTGKPLRVYQSDGTYSDYSTDEFVGKNLNKFEGWYCGAGTDSLMVGMDGEIHGASCTVGGQYGNVFEDFEVPQNWVFCDKPVCSCGADLFIPKAADSNSLSLLKRTFSQPETKAISKTPVTESIKAMERTFVSNLKQVYWEIGRRCNYDCSYCWPWIHNKTDKHKTLKELVNATDLVIEKFGKGSRLHFIISGGEPTLNPDFMDWARYIHGLGHSLSMHSNGFRAPDYYRELVHYGDLNFSAHFEFLEPDKFADVIAEVTDEKVVNKNQGVGHLEVKFMMDIGGREKALSLRDKLFKIPNFQDYCTWAFVPLRDIKKGEELKSGYDPEDFELFGN